MKSNITINIERTTANNNDFKVLVALLDQDLAFRDGEEHTFHAQYNKIDLIKHVLVAYVNQIAVGCGAIKHFDNQTAEIKRMFVTPQYRGKGVATEILSALEAWALQLNYTATQLETGVKYPEAIALYLKNGYKSIPRYGQYEQVLSSRCFKKYLINTI